MRQVVDNTPAVSWLKGRPLAKPFRTAGIKELIQPLGMTSTHLIPLYGITYH